MFCDVPRSNLHFLRDGGFHRNDTFRHISYINPGTNLVINVTFASFFYPMRPQGFVTSQEVTYIFGEMEASTEMTPSNI